MHKTFLKPSLRGGLGGVLLLAATALTTTTLVACSDDDDIDESSEDLANDESVVDPTEFIMENIVVFSDSEDGSVLNQQFAQWGMYGGNVDETDASGKVMEYTLEAADTEFGTEAETAREVFYNLVPAQLEQDIQGTGDNLSLTYQDMNGQTQKLTMQSTSDGGAIIQLPDVSPWNQYVTALVLHPAQMNNDEEKPEVFKDFKTGMAFKFEEIGLKNTAVVNMALMGDNGIAIENIQDPELTEAGISVLSDFNFYYFGFRNQKAYFVFTPSEKEQNIIYQKDDTFSQPLTKRMTTNVVYNNCEEFLPDPVSLLYLKKHFRNFAANVFYRTVGQDINTAKENAINGAIPDLVDKIFKTDLMKKLYATSRKSNPLIGHKKVMYVNFNSEYQDGKEAGWKEKNSNNILYMMYMIAISPEDMKAK